MNYITLVLIVLVYSTNSLAIVRDNIHFPNLGTKAETLGSGNYRFTAHPGSNSTSSFFTNSYMLGITDNFDIGVIPLYTSQDNFFNINFKYLILGNRTHQFSANYTHIEFRDYEENRLNELEGDHYSLMNINMRKDFLGLAYNYTPQNELFNFNTTLNLKFTTIKTRVKQPYNTPYITKEGAVSERVENYYYNESQYTGALDLIFEGNYYIKKKYWLGLSLASMRRDDLISFENEEYTTDNQLVYGSNIAYQGSVWELSNINFGVAYFSTDQETGLNLSADF